jgi:Dolichyl-phosphate-mannose-protein mannosyltransferase
VLQQTQDRESTTLADRTDWALACGLMALGLALRLLYFSGFGLGDDILFRHFINTILQSRTIPPDNFSYRATWWFPTALAARLLGLDEPALALPITAAATLGIGVVYLLGKLLFGRPGGVIAALLLIFQPLDFASSTMLANDILGSLFSALCFLFVLLALEPVSAVARRRRWILAAVSLWLSYHAKVTAVILLPAVALVAWARRARLDREALSFVATVGGLLAFSHLAFYVVMGRVDWPYYAETTFQGLTGEAAAQSHRLTAEVFWIYPRLLFRPYRTGDWLFSVYPQLLVLFGLLGWTLGLRSSLAVFWWLLFAFLGMQFNIQRAHGVWVAGFRNVRHIHVLVYPLVLLLAGYVAGCWKRWPWITAAGLALLLGFSAWQCVSAATKTKVSFDDRRRACHFLATLPPRPVYSDMLIETWCGLVPLQQPEWVFHYLHGFDRRIQKNEIAGITSGYLVTGGGRDPWYGCVDCIPRAEDVDRERWQLLLEVPGLPYATPWRSEPLRVWAPKDQPS